MSIVRKLLLVLGAACLAAVMNLSAAAQTPEASGQKQKQDVLIERSGVVVSTQGPGDRVFAQGIPMAKPDDVFFSTGANLFAYSEMSVDGTPIKGAPYSADAVTETIQTLPDGNRIVRKNTSTIYRDSEGRTRRDQSLAAVGPYAVAGDPPQSSFINDPVTGDNFVLDARSHIAHKMPQFKVRMDGVGGADSVSFHSAGVGGADSVRLQRAGVGVGSGKGTVVGATTLAVGVGKGVDVETAPGTFTVKIETAEDSKTNVKKESLGTQLFEGVSAEGTRVTKTIPAGAIGNERPIDIVSERWYSSDLHVVVMSKQTNPMVGETTYRLTNINRSEPSHSMFEVPADYKLDQGMEKARIMIQDMEKKLSQDQ
jgi:hypothetical protein